MIEAVWPMVVAVVAAVSGAATVVIYIVRSETRAVRDLVILDREVVKLRLTKVEDALVKMENAISVLADYKWQLKIVEERSVAQGSRLDDLTRRFNTYFDTQAAQDRLNVGSDLGVNPDLRAK